MMPADGMSAAKKLEQEEIGISPGQLAGQITAFQYACKVLLRARERNRENSAAFSEAPLWLQAEITNLILRERLPFLGCRFVALASFSAMQ
jgi:hypothetical protein